MGSKLIRLGLGMTATVFLVTQYVNCGAKGKFDGNDTVATSTLQPGSVALQPMTSSPNAENINYALYSPASAAAASTTANPIPQSLVTSGGVSITADQIARGTFTVSGICNPGDDRNRTITMSWLTCADYVRNYSDIRALNPGTTSVRMYTFTNSNYNPTLFPNLKLFPSNATAAVVNSTLGTATLPGITTSCTNGRFSAFVPPPYYWFAVPGSYASKLSGMCVLQMQLNQTTSSMTVYIN